jgi:hypothetical protein
VRSSALRVAMASDETGVGAGGSLAPPSHALRVKAFYSRVVPDAAGMHGFDHLQTQPYVF